MYCPIDGKICIDDVCSALCIRCCEPPLEKCSECGELFGNGLHCECLPYDEE